MDFVKEVPPDKMFVYMLMIVFVFESNFLKIVFLSRVIDNFINLIYVISIMFI